MTSIFKKNDKGYKVYTPAGYMEFSGIAYMGDKKIIKLELEDGIFLECTENHKVYLDDVVKLEITNLEIGDKLITESGYKSIISIVDTGQTNSVYDLIDVNGGHRYFTNGVLSSNCVFAGEENTLINSLTLQRLTGINPLFKINDVRWYDKPTGEKTYLVALDPSAGVGKDSACIQVFSLPDLVQVAEWTNNRVTPSGQIRVMHQIINYIYTEIKKTGYKGEPDIYYTLENNSWGEACIVALNDIGEDNFYGQMLHEPKRPGLIRRKGLNTNVRSKAFACSKFKTLVESNKLKINSKSLIRQLKFFVSSRDSFAAKSGEHDDCVMSTLQCVRMMQMVTNWDDRISEAMRDSLSEDGDDDRDPLPFAIVIS